MKLKLLLPLLLYGAISVYGQVNLSGMVPQSTDSLQKCKIRYFSPGRGGMNRVWDFSKKLGSKESSQVMFMKDSTGMVSVIETGNITYDWNNNPKQIYFTNGSVTKYVYSASGKKLRAVHYTAKPNITRTWGVKPAELTSSQILQADSTDYLLGGSLTLKNGKVDKYLFDGGYAQATPASSATESFSVLAQIHTHQDTTGDASPSFYGEGNDGNLAAKMKIPVFVLGHNNNVYGIVSNRDQYSIFSLPGNFSKVSSLPRTNLSFAEYIKNNNWQI